MPTIFVNILTKSRTSEQAPEASVRKQYLLTRQASWYLILLAVPIKLRQILVVSRQARIVKNLEASYEAVSENSLNLRGKTQGIIPFDGTKKTERFDM